MPLISIGTSLESDWNLIGTSLKDQRHNTEGCIRDNTNKKMGIETQIQLFDNAKIRVVWDDEKEKYFFSVVDIVSVLTESSNPQTYWRVLKKRLMDEGNETVTNCNALKLPASDGIHPSN